MGFFIGSILAGFLGDKYGRRKPLIAANIIFSIFGFLSGLVQSYNMLLFVTFLFGIEVDHPKDNYNI